METPQEAPGTHSIVRPERLRSETEKRWLSWQVVTNQITQFGRKHSYAGTASPTAVAKRRAKNKVAKQTRKANR